MKVLFRLVLVFALLRAGVALTEKVFTLNPFWPVWVIPLLGALGVELILWTYRFERRAVGPRRGKALVGLRLMVLGLLMWVLLQPVWSRLVDREVDQELVILVDDSASMNLVDEGQSQTRLQLAEEFLTASKLEEEVDGKLRLREMRMARGTISEGEGKTEGWNQATDLAGALSSVMEVVPPDKLAGVVLLSDGRHNRPGSVEDVARRFGILDAPIAVIAAGSEVPPKDVAIVSVDAPDSVYLGDRIRLNAQVKFNGYRGKQAEVKLFSREQLLEIKKVVIPQENYREEIRFRHVPEAGGVWKYRVMVEALEGERFADNNEWEIQAVISDARTNVLLLDSHPRWEFRYLRNLFYGRDKSIHLQSVLLEPDRVSGQNDNMIAASASRPFGESSATELPVSEDEWRKFDVIIVGDIGPGSLGQKEWGILKRCVEERGALLVLVAGPKSMPHAFSDAGALSLIPVDYKTTRRTYFGSEEEFRLTLTNAGKLHPVMEQVEGRLKNEQVWAGFPAIRWRHPITGVKAGAEVLLYAGELEDKGGIRNASGLQDALQEMTMRKETEAKNALLVTRQTGKGKVAILLSDRTWRLREGVGDVHHHRFWGQLMRWGAGPNLRAGNATTRLGTDQLTYTGGDRVLVMARLRDESLNPLNEEAVEVEILREGTSIARTTLNYRQDSNGFYEGVQGPFLKSGPYEVRLNGSQVKTGFRVVEAMSAVELAETTLNRPLLENVARLSGGRLVEAADHSLASLFLLEKETREELRETTLWDRWPILALLMGLLSVEWVLRRSGGLS